MKLLIVFSAFFVAITQGNVAFDRSAVEHEIVPILAAPVELRYGDLKDLGYTLYQSQDVAGQYKFGYETASNKRTEARDALGAVVGSYSYIGTDGKLQTINYRADENGFNVAGTNIPDASGLETVKESEEVAGARAAHLKAYDDFVAGKYVLPAVPELPAAVELKQIDETEEVAAARTAHLKAQEDFIAGKYVLPSFPEVPELKTIEDEAEVALAKKEFLAKYDASVELLKKNESGELVLPIPIGEIPEAVTDEPQVALAKKEHNEYREALKEQFEILEKLAVPSLIPAPIVDAEGRIHEVQITPAFIPETQILKEVSPIVVEAKIQEPFIAPTTYIVPSVKSVAPIVVTDVEVKIEEPLVASVSSIIPSVKTVVPIVTETKIEEPLIAPATYVVPSVKTIAPIVAEGKIEKPIVAPFYPSYFPYLPYQFTPELKTIAEGKVETQTYPTLFPYSSYVAPELKSVAPIVSEGKLQEPLLQSAYIPHPSVAVDARSPIYGSYYYPYTGYPYGYPLALPQVENN